MSTSTRKKKKKHASHTHTHSRFIHKRFNINFIHSPSFTVVCSHQTTLSLLPRKQTIYFRALFAGVVVGDEALTELLLELILFCPITGVDVVALLCPPLVEGLEPVGSGLLRPGVDAGDGAAAAVVAGEGEAAWVLRTRAEERRGGSGAQRRRRAPPFPRTMSFSLMPCSASSSSSASAFASASSPPSATSSSAAASSST